MATVEIKPQLLVIAPWDATRGTNVYFTSTSPRQIVGNQIEVKDASTGLIEYSYETTSFEKMHPLPPNQFENGKRYTAMVRVKYSDESYSEWSNTVQFRCFATPALDIISIDGQGYVFNQNVTFIALYSQSDNEKVKTYRFHLYDENEDLLQSFPIRYPAVDGELSETVPNLEKGKGYFIKCVIETVNGMTYDHMEKFIPLYITPSTTGIIQTVNDDDEGFVRITAMLKKVTGTQVFGLPQRVKKAEIHEYRRMMADPRITRSMRNARGYDDYVYIDNEWVIVPSHAPIIFRRLNMNRASDFVLKVWAKGIPNGNKFLHLSPEDNGGIAYQFFKYEDRIVVKKEHAGVTSNHRSNIVTIPDGAPFYVGVKVIEHRMDINLEIL